MRNFFHEIKHFWIATWIDSKLLFFTELICTLMGMTAATILNFGANDPDMMLVFLLYTISAVGLAGTSYYRKTPMMVILMIFYFLIGIVGISKLITGG